MSVPTKYQNPPQAPPVFTATPDSIVAAAKRITEKSQLVLDKVAAGTTPENASFNNTLKLMLEDDNVNGGKANIVTFYQHVSADPALRQASTEAEEIFNDFGVEAMMRDDVFKVVDGAYQNRASQGLKGEELHILEKSRQKYVRYGLLVPAGPQRDRFKEIQKRISQLCLQSQKNLNEENGACWFTKEELEGVPADYVDPEKLEKGTGENEGKLKMTFKYPTYLPAMKFAVQEETRRRYQIAEANKVICSLARAPVTLLGRLS